MKRKKFIKKSTLSAVGTYFIPSFLNALNPLILNPQTEKKKLVVIQLSGGNDGLNTVVPYENDLYHNFRSKIRIPKKEVLKLNDELGFNPNMKEFHKLYKEGFVSVINAVGYPNPNRSHFRSMDIWHSAVDANKYSKTGWLGRYMDAYCDKNHAMLEIDSQQSLSLKGLYKNGLAIEDSGMILRTLRGSYTKDLIKGISPKMLNEENQGYLYKTLIQANQSARYLAKAHHIKQENHPFPKSPLGKKLNQVSQLIRSELDTQVYYVSHNGFDSHVNQRRSQDRLLKEYSQSVAAFVESLKKDKKFNNTLILTFSEFGRRVKENGSLGTDHGKANCLFLVGKNLKNKGVYNTGPNLKDLDGGDVKFMVDFRSVYQEIITEWFEKDAKDIISKNFDKLNVI